MIQVSAEGCPDFFGLQLVKGIRALDPELFECLRCNGGLEEKLVLLLGDYGYGRRLILAVTA